MRFLACKLKIFCPYRATSSEGVILAPACYGSRHGGCSVEHN